MIRTPGRSVRNTTGLKLQIDTQWVDASGYRDVRVHVTTAGGTPSPRDRELRIELAPNSYRTSENKFVVSQFVTLPQGAITTSAHMLVPQNQPWHEIVTRVYDGGRLSRQLSARTTISNHVSDEWSEAVPAILVIDSAAPTLLDRYVSNLPKFAESKVLSDTRALEMLAKRDVFDPASEVRPNDKELLRRVASTPRLELIPPADLPERWIGLTCFDLIIISHRDLMSMSTRQLPKFRAIVDWVTTGGNLLVFGMGDEYERLNATEKLLSMEPMTKDGDFQAAGWTPNDAKLYNDAPLRQFQQLQPYGRSYYGVEEMPAEPRSPSIASLATAFGTGGTPKFLHRELGMGMVIAMATDDPFPGATTDWSWVLNTIGEGRAMWYRRHGLSLRRKNNDFWEFLVPETGKAPVLAFCVLISLFAVLIGPVNYFVLARQKRLYLLLATIPLGALLVTLGLFGYAMVTDGLGTQVRLRSYTHVDQSSGRMVNWSRQSYYAGLAPSRGLTFPEDTAVFTYEQFPHHEQDDRWQRPKTMQWNEGEQNLATGYLTSRVTAQFVTIRTGESSASLQLDGRTKPTSARNMLGGDIQLLLLRDAAGNFFTATDGAAGEKCSLKPADYTDVKNELQKALFAARPATPEGLDPNQFENWMGQGWSPWGMLDNGLAETHTSTSLMEIRIRQIQGFTEKSFPNATYIAIVSTSPEVPLGVKASENGSFHLVEGEF